MTRMFGRLTTSRIAERRDHEHGGPMPSSATFIADMPEKDGRTKTMATAAAGDEALAYTTNGANDEATSSAPKRTVIWS